MMGKEEIEILKEVISKEEYEIKRLEDELEQRKECLSSHKKKLKLLSMEKLGCLSPGRTLRFKDEDGLEIEVKIVVNKKGNYDGLLMTNYENNYDYMSEYYIFGYNCLYTDTLVEELENNYNWTYIG